MVASIVFVSAATPALPADYAALVTLFEQWRAFEHPASRGDVPDDTAAAMTTKVAHRSAVARGARSIPRDSTVRIPVSAVAHFIPYTWAEEVVLLRRELERAHAALRLEEHNNRNRPPLEPPANAATFDKMARAHLDAFADFLVNHRIIPDKPGARLPEHEQELAGKPFVLSELMDRFNTAGMIPIPLIARELVGTTRLR